MLKRLIDYAPEEFDCELETDIDFSDLWGAYNTDEDLRDAYESVCEGSCYMIDGFSRAAIGLTRDDRIVYSFEAIISILMEEDMSYEEAVEYYEYNIVRSLPYFRPSPVVLRYTEE